MRRRFAAALAAVSLLAAGCAEPTARPPVASGPPFTDATEAAGLRFVHTNGATPRRYLPETMGAGAAFFDADGDGWPDLFLVGGAAVERAGGAEAPGNNAFYRNRGDGTFEDVTREAGLDVPMLGMGAAVGDVDNDGDPDLLVTAVGGDHLFLNRGDGTFASAGDAWTLGAPGFSSSAAFLDFDRDGWLDLFLGRYVEWSPATDLACRPDGTTRIYCTPEVYQGANDLLLRNLGGQGFEEVTETAGLSGLRGKTLGVVPLDHDGDGWPDLAVANDTSPNLLLRNRRDGSFEDVAQLAGVAVAESGSPRGGMGIDAGDWSGDGLVDLVIGNFAQEMTGLYCAATGGIYFDEAAESGVGLPSLMLVTFGALLLDQDGDGRLDLLFANGHIEPEIARFRRGQRHLQPLQLFRNLGDGKFQPIEIPGPWQGPWAGRGLATADYDRDGDPDVVLTQNGGPARLLRNEANPRRWLRVELEGRTSNRSAYGAVLDAVAGERRLVRTASSGRSYLSASDPTVTFGLEQMPELDRLEIRWPSGVTQTILRPPLGRTLRVVEGEEPHALD